MDVHAEARLNPGCRWEDQLRDAVSAMSRDSLLGSGFTFQAHARLCALSHI